MPPAAATSALPFAGASNAWRIARMPEPRTLLTVALATERDRPAPGAVCRASPALGAQRAAGLRLVDARRADAHARRPRESRRAEARSLRRKAAPMAADSVRATERVTIGSADMMRCMRLGKAGWNLNAYAYIMVVRDAATWRPHAPRASAERRAGQGSGRDARRRADALRGGSRRMRRTARVSSRAPWRARKCRHRAPACFVCRCADTRRSARPPSRRGPP